jgi:hypothetical protein
MAGTVPRRYSASGWFDASDSRAAEMIRFTDATPAKPKETEKKPTRAKEEKAATKGQAAEASDPRKSAAKRKKGAVA